jgi:hypothetical protein
MRDALSRQGLSLARHSLQYTHRLTYVTPFVDGAFSAFYSPISRSVVSREHQLANMFEICKRGRIYIVAVRCTRPDCRLCQIDPFDGGSTVDHPSDAAVPYRQSLHPAICRGGEPELLLEGRRSSLPSNKMRRTSHESSRSGQKVAARRFHFPIQLLQLSELQVRAVETTSSSLQRARIPMTGCPV